MIVWWKSDIVTAQMTIWIVWLIKKTCIICTAINMNNQNDKNVLFKYRGYMLCICLCHYLQVYISHQVALFNLIRLANDTAIILHVMAYLFMPSQMNVV